ncbi:TPA: hypothetical protein N0F65_005258 [Lagenidium giganteum]|uniref:Exopolysaccharide phosphotransferase n=1 Tax=Lagenidium giganteum TaxID=4803 RepID=A0AAV2YWQ8_9STRA|nr:TPA: hypothetical protein N0F65_005258 [Lagenidium giganteum]
MQSPSAVRMRVVLGNQRNLPLLLVGCVVTLLLIVIALDRSPPEQKYDTLTTDEVTDYSDEALDKYFNGKCKIKNFESLRRMSIVYTWVNGSLPCYRQQREEHGGKHAVGGSRDREIGELKYSIRSLKKYMPWHTGLIYIVSPGHIPNWLDMNNPRIKVINQDDLFPEYAKQFLPTFNTHVLEQFLYLIPGLSDIYMQINDDYIFTAPIDPQEFFTCDGGIRLLHESGMISHTPPTPKKGIWISSVLHTQQEMDLRWGQKDRYFIKHAPFVYSRHAFERIHQIFDRPLYMTLKSKFRGKPDMNVPLLHHYYMMSQGSEELGIPIQSPPEEEMQGYKLILMQDDNVDGLEQIFSSILEGNSEYRIVALNDEYSEMRVADTAKNFLNKFLPEPSEYELKPGAESHPLTIRKPDTCGIDETILAPFPRRVEASQKFQVVAYREQRWVAFMNSLLRGMGVGIGLMTVYVFYLLVLRPQKHSKGSSAYDKV